MSERNDNLNEGQMINFKDLAQQRKDIVSNWEKSGLLEGLKPGMQKSNIAQILECQSSHLLNEVTLDAGVIVGIKPGVNDIKLRYNTNRENAHDVWRLFINGQPNIVSKVYFHVPVETTVDLEEETQTHKANISCSSENIEFKVNQVNKNIITVNIR